jgi:signal transduction histidine kinase/ActR/RegA family two-component response regulator
MASAPPNVPVRARPAADSQGIATLATSPGRAPTDPLAIRAASEPPVPAARAPSGAIGRVDREIQQLGRDALQPAAAVVALVFVAFTIYNWLAFPIGVRGPICIYDIALIGVGATVFRICRTVQLSLRGVHLGAAVLSLTVLGNILLAALLGSNPMFSFYVAVLVIASVGSVVLPSWAIGVALIELVAWGAVAYVVLEPSQLTLNTFVMLAALSVAVIVHVGRYRARNRIIALRAGDARREAALQHALAEADEARRGLDRKVEERTAALRTELEERERLEEQLRHAQKLEAVGRLAGGIAHDFNNLLTVIRMSLVTVGETAASPDELREAIRDASDATDRAAALTHDLLAFARKQTLQRTTVAVRDILGGVERMVRRVAEASIRLEVTAAGPVGEVLADRHQIEQVLLNLAINACDAMGDRGTLTITADALELAGAEAIRHRVRPGAWVRIAVTDTGTGMDEVTRRSIFEPFFTTKEVGRGTGLGLAVAHGIVTQHGGQINVESELGRGSTFNVLLPQSHGTSQRHAVPTMQPVPALARETLLVVEDEAAVRRAVQRNLERLGYHVLPACDGEDALRIAGALEGIDLLLTDVVMPGMDGPELAVRLRDRWAGLPVLFVTGYSADRLARTGAVGPHDRVLEKPYQLADLTRTIRNMLETRAAHAKTASTGAPPPAPAS